MKNPITNRPLNITIFFLIFVFIPLKTTGQTGNTQSNPIIVGTYNTAFSYTNTQNTVNFTNNYTGKTTNDVFYRFTLSRKMEITMRHCGSSLSDTYLYLLDSSGNQLSSNDDYSGTGACSSSYHSYLKQELNAGIYYVVSEGYSQNGTIQTQITGTVITPQGDSFQNPINLGEYNSSFQSIDTQNTENFTNQHTTRPPNDVFYRFTLTRKMHITLTHCGSGLSDTYMYLLNASGDHFSYNDDHSGDGACPSVYHSFIQRTLDPGTYYIVSEGYSSSGSITTNLTGFASDEFNYPNIPNAYSSDPAAVGTTNSSLEVSPTGAAVYSIPIKVPEGINKLQPSLAIVYNSQSGNGIAGWGTGLSGLSVITRAPKDIYHDNIAGALTHQANEAYYLDGQRLIHTFGTAGQEGAVYYPESDPFTRITVHGVYNTTTANTWFEVETAAGMTYRYGSTSSGKHSYTSGSTPRIHAWYLDYAEDPLGNYMNYSYNKYSHCVYPTLITYGNNNNASTSLQNTVNFTYESRSDTQPFVIEENVKGSQSYRLQTVTSKTGNNIYRTYSLQYNTTSDGSGTKYSRLTGITEKNEMNEEQKPIQLNWSYLPNFTQSISQPTVNSPSAYPVISFGEQQFMSGDFNGDGLTDILGIGQKQVGNTPIYESYANIYYASQNNQFQSNQQYNLGDNIEVDAMRYHMSGSPVVDFDGDGKSDFIIPHMNVINFGSILRKQIGFFIYNPANQQEFGPIGYELINSIEMPVYGIGDFNNDGKGDFLYIEKGHQSNNYHGEIFGSHSWAQLYQASIDFNLPSNPEKLFVSDFNSDGLQDIIVFYNGGYTIFWNQGGGITNTTFSNSSDKKTTGTNIANTWRIWPGDFNGDGQTDFLMSAAMDNKWYFALNNGNGTFTKTQACTLEIYDQDFTDRDDDKFNCHIYDFDLDGKSDVIITKAMYEKFWNLTGWHGRFDKTHTHWMRSTGSTLVQVRHASSNREEDALSSRYVLGDFNGDGQQELINYGYDCYNSTDADNSPVWRILRNNNHTPNKGKVTTITDGFGSTTNISYASLADSDNIYTPGTGSTYPVTDCTPPIHAVKTVTASNGAAGSTTTGYRYSGLKLHRQGRGILGMKSQTATNTVQGIISESGIKSWDTTFHVPTGNYLKTTVNGQTAETRTTFTIVNKGSKKYFAHPYIKTEKNLDGDSVITISQFNIQYGYITEETAYFGNNTYKTVQYDNYTLSGKTYKPGLITRIWKHADDTASFTQKTAITYDPNKGYQTQTIENHTTTQPLTTHYTYDPWGNLKTTMSTGSGITPLTVTYNYDPTRRFISSTVTSPSTTMHTFTRDTWGNILQEKDETNTSGILTTTHTYDNWGTRTSTTLPDGRKTTRQAGWNNKPDKRYFILTQGTGQPWKKTWYDNRGREVLTETMGKNNLEIRQTTTYNNKGQIIQKQYQEGNLLLTETLSYDHRGRIASQSSSGQSTTYTYGNRSSTTISNGRSHTKTYDSWGNLKTATDPVSTVTYTYTSSGQPQTVTTGGATLTMTYHDTGQQHTLTDPNAGTITSTYDAAGRLTGQTNGRGKTTLNKYDAIGRIDTILVDGIATSYTYGTSGNDKLRLIRIQTGNSYISWNYDQYGRIQKERRHTEGTLTEQWSYYNSAGQLGITQYMGSIAITRQYDAYGNLQKITANSQPIWERTAYNGTVSVAKLGETQTTYRWFDAYGRLYNQKTQNSTTVLHDISYSYNSATGNIASRTGMFAHTEHFNYDSMDRLTNIQQSGLPPMNITYRPNGNIHSKTGLGEYSYDNRPHAVSFIENTGELISQKNQQITYTPFNKTSTISETTGTDNYQLNITYGPDRQRWKTTLQKNGNLQKTVIYANGHEIITENGVTKTLYYISGEEGLAGIYVKQSGQADRIYYVHTDHQGSIVKLTDQQGTEVFKAIYDPWGKRTVTNSTFPFHRGYTGHEHLPEFNLINMNGRMYDPILARFLSPDPFIQTPDFSQSFNRYSYCLNNPLKYTDPTGEWFGIDDLLIAGAGLVIGYVGHGISTGNWGWKAVAAGGMGAGMAWLGYNTAGMATGAITNATWSHVGSMAINAAANQIMPSMNIPISDHFGVSISPAVGLGPNGLSGGFNMTGTYTNGDLSVSAGIGAGDNYWGWNVSAMDTRTGYGGGYGQTSYGATEVMGQQLGAQRVGTYTAYFNHNSFSISNDLWGDKKDRWRTSAAELTIGKFSAGTYLYTNWGEDASGGQIDKSENGIPPWPVGRKTSGELRTWKNGRPYSAPFWVGYRNGNQITRIGFSHKIVHNLTQNMVHKFMDTPYYVTYDEFRRSGYFYTGYRNPLSLWDR